MSPYNTIKIADNISRSDNGINIFYAMSDVTINTNYTLDEFLRTLSTTLTVSKETLKDHPTARALRDFYWSMGVDPTKIKPSREALARRFVVSKKISKINNVVYAGNIPSKETLVPLEIYNANKIGVDVNITPANSEEEFMEISNGKPSLYGKESALSESNGVMQVFLFPDASRMRANEETKGSDSWFWRV